jgi:hypothetical protein
MVSEQTLSAERFGDMPRYFLHVVDTIEAPDEEGVEFADVWMARDAAIKGARELVCEQIRQGFLDLGGYIQIASDSGEPLMRVGFQEAFEVTGASRME